MESVLVKLLIKNEFYIEGTKTNFGQYFSTISDNFFDTNFETSYWKTQFSKLQEGPSFPTCYASAHCRNFFKYESTCVCLCRRKKKFMANSVKILENLNILNLMWVSIKEDKNQGKINLCRRWHKTSTWLYFHFVTPVRGSDRKIKSQKGIPNWYFLRKVNR